MHTRIVIAALLLLPAACGGGSEEGASSTLAGSSYAPEPAEGELPSQDEIDRQAAEQIDAENADKEFQKLLEELNQEG